MPIDPTYPGVYIAEIPSGVHTIIGVATSITAFLGRTPSGPANVGVTLTTFGDFERSFGGLDPDYPLGYAVCDFFANGGGRAVVVRLFRDGEIAAAAAVAKQIQDSAGADVAAVRDAGSAVAATFTVEPAKSAAAAVVAAAKEAATPAGATIDAVKAAAKTAAEAVTENSSARCEPNDHLKLKAAGPGAWGNKLFVSIDKDGITSEIGERYGLDAGVLFNLNVFNNPTFDGPKNPNRPLGPPDERIQNVSLLVNAGERRLDRMLKKASNLIVSTSAAFYPDVTTASASDAPIADLATPDEANLKVFMGGSDSGPLAQEDYQGSIAKKTGIHGLDDVDLFNILCLPPDVRDSETAKAVYGDALKYCVAGRAVLIVDPPTAWSSRVTLLNNPAQALSGDVGLAGPDARNAFLYYPRVKMPDPKLGGAIATFPACGIIAGIFARTDTQRGVWVAPAGLDASLGSVSLEVNLTDWENGLLNSVAINCLRTFPLAGPVVWGSRTLRGADQLADQWKYLPVRRTALFLEESLFRGTKWVVFQPNDESLWALIRLNVGSFMNDMFRKGAFQGTKPEDGYFVRCDQTTTTQNDIDRGVVNIVVGFAPLKPAEFVIIQLQQVVGQLQV